MKEADIIRAIRKHLKPSASQRGGAGEADAEIVEVAGGLLAFSVDDFSAEDAMALGDPPPEALGWNVAAATLSDLLAVGAEPKFMLHSLVISPGMDARVLEGLSAGVQEALDAFGAAMLGGDVGTGGQWRYTGFAIGSFGEGAVPLTRRVAADEGLLVATGAFGDANLAAATGAPAPRFECRLGESRRIAREPAACIDTSDGLARAVETLAEVNPHVRFVIDLEAVPYAGGVAEFAASSGVRPEAFLFGSAGEYELVACVSQAHGRALLEGGGFAAIGSFRRDRAGGIYYRPRGGDRPIPHAAVPDPREIGDLAAYRNAVVALTEKLFGQGDS